MKNRLLSHQDSHLPSLSTILLKIFTQLPLKIIFISLPQLKVMSFVLVLESPFLFPDYLFLGILHLYLSLLLLLLTGQYFCLSNFFFLFFLSNTKFVDDSLHLFNLFITLLNISQFSQIIYFDSVLVVAYLHVFSLNSFFLSMSNDSFKLYSRRGCT